MRRPDGGGNAGYVMIVTLVTILLIAIGLATAAQLVQGAQRRLGTLDKIDQFRMDALTARNEIIFLILRSSATTNVSLETSTIDGVTGIDPVQFIEREAETFAQSRVWRDYLLGARLRLDDLPVEVYDRAALINVNSRSDPFILFAAQMLGLEEPNAALAALRDFTDADDFVSVGGAEQSDYDESGIIVPNRPLHDVSELCLVKHWDKLSQCDNPMALARVFAVSDTDFLKFRMADQDLRRIFIGERNMAPVSMQIIRWLETAEIRGFFDAGLIGGASGPQYRLIVGPEPDTGRIQVIDFMVVAGNAARPYEIQRIWEAQVPADSPASSDDRD